MKTANLLTRDHFKERRALAAKRRSIVAPQILEKLKPYLCVPTLSFCSLLDEIDMTYVNEYLLRKNLLILPRIVGNRLALHQVVGPLVKNEYGIWEPNKASPLAFPKLALIPGLAFDRSGGRIGYGKGYYDRLLADLKVDTIGIAFEEQLYSELKLEAHDHKVDRLFIF